MNNANSHKYNNAKGIKNITYHTCSDFLKNKSCSQITTSYQYQTTRKVADYQSTNITYDLPSEYHIDST